MKAVNKKSDGNFIYPLNVIFIPNLRSLGWFLFSSTFISCCQLLTAVDSWWQQIWIKFDWNSHVHSIGDFFAKFQLSRLIFFSSAFDSCHQLLTAVNSWWQLIWITFDWNFHVHSIDDIFAKFQLSKLIFIFISLLKLLSAVDSCYHCWQLMTAVTKKNHLEFSSTP